MWVLRALTGAVKATCFTPLKPASVGRNRILPGITRYRGYHQVFYLQLYFALRRSGNSFYVGHNFTRLVIRFIAVLKVYTFIVHIPCWLKNFTSTGGAR